MNFPIAIYLFLTALPLVWALLAAPDSACASVCIDSTSGNASDPKAFETFDTDLTCSDGKYSSTDSGRNFRDCNSCLQNSTSSSQGVTDQGALMYNLRATVDYCLWGFPNASAAVSNPCGSEYACGPLKKALTYDGLKTSNGTGWGYCSADGGAFLGENLSPCIQCFQATADETYIANFLIALEAGCKQKPQVGQVIGLEGNLFSKTQVNITALATASPAQSGSNGMKTGTVVGIAIAGVLFLLGAVTFSVVCFRKRRADQKGMAQLKSDYDTRYGAGDISAPMSGGFAQPPSPSSISRDKNALPDYERRAQKLYGGDGGDSGGGAAGDRLSDEPAIPRKLYTAAWLATPSRSDVIPAHPAYLPQYEQVSPPPRVTFSQSKSPIPSPMSFRSAPSPMPSLKSFKPSPSPVPSFKSTKSAVPSLASRRDNVSPGFVNTSRGPSDYEMINPATPGLRTHLLSPGLPATPKASLFSRFGTLGRSPHTPGLPPKTPNDIWN